MRSRLWLALLANSDLCCTYQDGQVNFAWLPAMLVSAFRPLDGTHGVSKHLAHNNIMYMQVLQAQPALSALGTSSNSRSGPNSFSSFHSSDSFVPVGSSSHAPNSIPSADTQQASPQPSADVTMQSHASSSQQVDAAKTTQPDLSDPFQQSVDALHAQETLIPSQDSSLATSGVQYAPNCINAPSKQDAAVQSTSPGPHANVPATEQQEPLHEGQAITHSPSVSSSAVEASTAATSPSPVGSASTDAWEMVQVTRSSYLSSIVLCCYCHALLHKSDSTLIYLNLLTKNRTPLAMTLVTVSCAIQRCTYDETLG